MQEGREYTWYTVYSTVFLYKTQVVEDFLIVNGNLNQETSCISSTFLEEFVEWYCSQRSAHKNYKSWEDPMVMSCVLVLPFWRGEKKIQTRRN